MANKDGGAVRGAIPENILIPIPGCIMDPYKVLLPVVLSVYVSLCMYVTSKLKF